MTSYNDIATKEDKIHVSNARRCLGHYRFNQLIDEARLVFIKAWDGEPNEVRKPNKARQAVNLLFTRAMNKKV